MGSVQDIVRGAMKEVTENFVKEKIVEFLRIKENGNWHIEKSKIAGLKEKGPDIVMVGGKCNGERFIIECKGKSYSKSAKSINHEGWLVALGQLVTRMDTKRLTGKNNDINRAYKYGLGLCEISAKVALKRIPNNIARILNLYIFSVNDDGIVYQYTPKDFKDN